MEGFKPFGNRVMVKVNKRLPRDEIKGILVPDTAKNTALEGDIVAMGPEVAQGGGVTIGDRVLCYELAGEMFDFRKETYLMVEIDEVLSLIEEVAA